MLDILSESVCTFSAMIHTTYQVINLISESESCNPISRLWHLHF